MVAFDVLDRFNDVMNRPLSECIKKIDTKEHFCIGLVVLAGIIEENPEKNTRRYDDMVHLCNIMAHYISVTNEGCVEIPLDIFCKLGVLAENYDEEVAEELEPVCYPKFCKIEKGIKITA